MLALSVLTFSGFGCNGQNEATQSTVPSRDKTTFQKIKDGLTPGKEADLDIEQTQDLFITVHCEPGSDPHSTGYQQLHWPALVDLVESAESHGHVLNIWMNPQWVSYILADSGRTNLVRSWVADGHELGIHHHGPHQGNWNGYTNQSEFSNSTEYIGTMDDAMKLYEQLLGEPPVAGTITDKDIAYDFPVGMPYHTSGGSDKEEHLYSTPETVTNNGQTYQNLTHARFGAERNAVNLDTDELELVLKNYDGNEIVGIVFHTFEYDENPASFDEMFVMLEERGISAQNVPDLIEQY